MWCVPVDGLAADVAVGFGLGYACSHACLVLGVALHRMLPHLSQSDPRCMRWLRSSSASSLAHWSAAARDG